MEDGRGKPIAGSLSKQSEPDLALKKSQTHHQRRKEEIAPSPDSHTRSIGESPLQLGYSPGYALGLNRPASLDRRRANSLDVRSPDTSVARKSSLPTDSVSATGGRQAPSALAFPPMATTATTLAADEKNCDSKDSSSSATTRADGTGKLIKDSSSISTGDETEATSTMTLQTELKHESTRNPDENVAGGVYAISSKYKQAVEKETTEVGPSATDPLPDVPPELMRYASRATAQDEICKDGLQRMAKLGIHSPEDVQVIGTLGRGAFSHVELVKDPQGTLHARKTLNKDLLVKTGQVEHVFNERDALFLVNHQSIPTMTGWSQDKDNLYFFMKPGMGGELAGVLQEQETLDEDTARFVAANLVLVLEYLHSRGIVYRDLKPENVLLDEKGYIKLVDFGFAKQIWNKQTQTFCGSPDYLAPEIVSNSGHGLEVDWWSLGILLYESVTGSPPFWDDNPLTTYVLIAKGEVDYEPEDVELSDELVDLLQKLLAPLPDRLRDPARIKSHPWFASLDFQNLVDEKMESPIQVELADGEDLSNFEDYLGADEDWEEYDIPDGEEDPFKYF